ncbi:MAG: hypothetical protein GY715_09595 [Planctomycetes bacterium]|nr:hypothetical protein [Planctomycetota bacterium]
MPRARIRNVAVVSAIATAALATGAMAEWISVTSPALQREAAPRVIVNSHDATGITVTVATDGVTAGARATAGGEFVTVTWPDASLAGAPGAPALPIVREFFLAPRGANVGVSMRPAVETTIDLAAAGLARPVIPMQPAVWGGADAVARDRFHFDQAAYRHPVDHPVVAVNELGIVRDRALYEIVIRPVSYDPSHAKLIMRPRIELEIRIDGGEPATRSWGAMNFLNEMVLNPEPMESASAAVGGNYLIVIDPGLAPSIVPFVQAKEAQGYDVTIYVVPAGSSAADIRNYIVSLWGTADAPDFVLLAGDTDTIPSWTGGGTTSSHTDLPYACMDAGDDWYCDLFVGRWPLNTVDQLNAVIDKSLHVDSGVFAVPTYTERATFIATSDMSSGAEEAHDWVVAGVMDPNGYDSLKLYARLGAGTGDVAAAINAGTVMATYFGHSGPTAWMGPAFNRDNVRSLTNAGMYPLVIGFTCNTLSYYGTSECVGETWLREANKGASAYIGATNYIYWYTDPWFETQDLELFLYEMIFTKGIHQVRPAWQAAMYDLLDKYGPADPVSRDYFEMLNLAGDPSVSIPMPNGFALECTPDVHAVCVPPATAAQFTLQITQNGDFDEVVTLSASNEPPGSTVSFSVGSGLPPFTSVMTVSDLALATPGHHTILLSGIAASQQHVTGIDLTISSGPPGVTALLDPPDEATDVSRQPTLQWHESPEVAEYDLELATDAAFANVVYTTTTTLPVHEVLLALDSLQQYFWHVRSTNACGDGGYSPAFTFTTLDQPDHFTEQFAGSGFDLSNTTVKYVPDGTGDYYGVCATEALEFPTDPNGPNPHLLTLGDDTWAQAYCSPYWVNLYGFPYEHIFVNSNGNLTFNGNDGSTYDETFDRHFKVPRVSALFDDLNPGAGGTVSYRKTSDRMAITFENVPEYGSTNSNSFQIEMFYDGEIHITWLEIGVQDGIAGLSGGGGLPTLFAETDLSASPTCPCPGDLDGSGDIGFGDILQVIGAWGPCPPACPADVDHSNDVGFGDILDLVGLWGPCE